MLSVLLRRWNLIKIPFSNYASLTPERIPPDLPRGGRQCQTKSPPLERRVRSDLAYLICLFPLPSQNPTSFHSLSQ